MEPARQGNPDAIGTLLNRSLRSQNIQARVRRQQTQLLILLTSLEPIEQTAIVPRILNGLQRLGVQGIESVQIAAQLSGQQSGATQILWRTQALTVATTPEASSAEPPQAVSVPPPAEIHETNTATASTAPADVPPNLVITNLAGTPNPLLLPGWSFWCGWVALSALGITLSSLWSPDGGILIGKRYFLSWLVSTWNLGLISVGQGIVLQQEVDWAKQWIQATAIGGLASSLLHVLRIMASRQWEGVLDLSLFPIRLLLLLIIATPLLVAQWYVLRRHLANADRWLQAMLGWAVVQSIMRGLLPTLLRAGAITINSTWLLAIINLMVSGGVMVYLLRQSAPETLKLNQLTDATTRRLLARQRTHVNGQLLLEWSGWTLLGWVVSSLVAGLLAVVTLGLSGLFSLAILVSTCAALQQIPLKRRMDNSHEWFKHTLTATIASTGLAIIPTLLVSGLAINAILSSSAPSAGLWSFITSLGIGFLVLGLTWFVAIAVQGRFLQQQGYRLSWWLGAHVAIVIAILGTRPAQELGYLLPGIVFWMVLIPAAVMVWLLGYPRSLQPHWQRFVD